MVPPKLLTDHNHTRRPGTVFPGMESASFKRRNAKKRKEVSADADAGNPFRRSHSAQSEATATTVKHRNLFERPLLVTPRQEVSGSHGTHRRLATLIRPHNDEALGLGIG